MRIPQALITLFIISTALVTFQSCKSDMDPRVKQRKAEVMVIHDEVMPLMSTTRKLRKQIKSHNHGDAGQLITDLENAEETMMTWMSDFGKIPKDGTVDDQLGFLDKMEEGATEMQSNFANAIKNAENYVNNHSH